MRQRCKTCEGRGYVEITVREEVGARILLEAAADWKLTTGDLTGPSRRKDIVEARRYVARDLRERGFRLKEIGQTLGGRDHATIA